MENTEDIKQIGDQINIVIAKFLEDKNEIFEAESIKTGGKKYVNNQNKTLAQLKKIKKDLEKTAYGVNGTTDDRKRFWEACRALSDFKKQVKKREEIKTTTSYTSNQGNITQETKGKKQRMVRGTRIKRDRMRNSLRRE